MEDEGNEYRWETGYEKTWESLTEDADGLLEMSVSDAIRKARRKRMLDKTGRRVRLGMMRHVYVMLDLSECMNLQDLKPTRLRCSLKLLESFVEEFFYLNPISQIGVITSRNKRAEIVSELAGNPRKHVEVLRGLANSACRGEPSLQNSLEVALQSLKHMPAHASRELVFVVGSLTTCDPGDVEATIAECQKLNVRCSVISLAAEVRIYRHLTKQTGGTYGVILDDVHFRDLLHAHLEPPPSAASAEASLIKMGFPCHSGHSRNESQQQQSGLGMCLCHLDASAPSPSAQAKAASSSKDKNQAQSAASSSQSATTGKLSASGFLCPQCQAKYCELPVECRACGLTLVSAPHLARSYHHLFPLSPFQETPLDSLVETASRDSCFACAKRFRKPKDSSVFKCPDCRHFCCVDCDIFLHETLHACPACSSQRGAPGAATAGGGAAANGVQ